MDCLEQQFYEQLVKKFSAGVDTFLVVKGGLRCDWKMSLPGFIEEKAYQLFKSIPESVGSEGPIFQASGRDLYDAYDNVLKCVKLEESKSHRKQLKEIDDEIEKELKKKKALEENFPIREETDSSGSLLKRKASVVHEDRVQVLIQRKKDLQLAYNAQHKEAIEALEEKKGFIKITRDEVTLVPNFIESENGIDWATRVANDQGNHTKFELSTAELRKQEPKRMLVAKTFFNFLYTLFFNQQVEFHPNERDDVMMSIEFEATSIITVTPGEWFKPSYLKVLAQKSRWADGHTTQDMFGPNGLLHSYITGYVVAYRPSIKISKSMCSDSSKELLKKVASNVGILKNSDNITFEAEKSTDEYDLTLNENAITYSSKSNYPQILGFLITKPAGDIRPRQICSLKVILIILIIVIIIMIVTMMSSTSVFVLFKFFK